LLVNKPPGGGEYKRILVGAEYPDRPTPWLEIALALAHHLRAELTVLHVVPPAGYVSDAHHVELEPRTVPKRLERLVSDLDATVPLQISVRRGDPARVVPQVARRLKADLVVLGAERGPEGWPGRVADRLARAGLPSLLYIWPDEEADEDFAGS
jgi:nucleotide-binding universal stress UspA family protein